MTVCSDDQTGISNVEQEISNDEVQEASRVRSAFFIRHSIFCGSLLDLSASRKEIAG
jgi:hypothetical protein